MLLRMHRPDRPRRLRTDRGLLLLVGGRGADLALTAAVGRSPSRRPTGPMAAAVRDAGPRGQVVATLPQWLDGASSRDPDARRRSARTPRTRGPRSPPRSPTCWGPASPRSATAPAAAGRGPGRYLQLAFAQTPDRAAAVTAAGGAPQAAPGPARTQHRP